MSIWTQDNQKQITKGFYIDLTGQQGGRFAVVINLDSATWQWVATIEQLQPHRTLEVPKKKLSARTPTRAAGKAVRVLMALNDSGDLEL